MNFTLSSSASLLASQANQHCDFIDEELVMRLKDSPQELRLALQGSLEDRRSKLKELAS